MKPVKLNAAERDLIKRYRKLSHESQVMLMSALAFQEGLEKSATLFKTILENYNEAVENLTKPDEEELHASCTG